MVVMPAEFQATTRPLDYENQRVVIRNTDCQDLDWAIEGCICNGDATALNCQLSSAPWIEIGVAPGSPKFTNQATIQPSERIFSDLLTHGLRTQMRAQVA